MQEELFVFLGTHQPLELVTMKAAQKNDFLPVHLQSALDDQGRQRLHGAFTGGRSAGYFNTVGSKEGFRPMEFSSSRSSRTNIASARPEDFMDDEDIKEIKAFSIGATQEYDQFGTFRAEKESKRLISDNIGLEKTALSDIAKHLAGDLITSSTDSIGSRLLRQMGWREGQGVGPRVKRQKGGVAINEEDVHSSGFSFAPSNCSVSILKPKKDNFGIGYQLDCEAPVIETKNGRRGGGFGVGIFEEEDEDVYQNDPNEYEVTLENDQMHDKKKNSHRSQVKSSGKLCKDGRPTLSGFVIVGKPFIESIKYSDPDVPPAFTGNHIFEEGNRPIRHGFLNPDQRRDILGEEGLKGPERSLIDENNAQADAFKVKQKSFSIPKITKECAKSALRGFMPFGNDKLKQANYKIYLGVMAGESAVSLDSISESDLREFSKAAEMYRPMSSFMASRFVSATTPDNAAAPMPQFPENQNDSIPKYKESSKAGRNIVEWRPDRLLCKRFDVPNPYYSKDQSEEEKKNSLLEKEALNEKTMESLKQERNRMLAANQIIEPQVEEDSSDIDDDNQNHQIIEKPSMDIFKAIFAESDSDTDVQHKERAHTIPKKQTMIQRKSEEKPESDQSLLFRPVFRKKEDRKGSKFPKKTSKPSAIRPEFSGVKLVFDFEEEGHQAIRSAKRTTIISKRAENKTETTASSEDEWIEAPQQPMSRPKASDLI